jgi:hypothetical protein
VNRIEGVEEQELFMNLNAGRVHLDGSDLVRAILITKVAKKEMEEFDSTNVKDVVRLNERRIRIGWELDEINGWWSKTEVSGYFSVFTSLKTGEEETIKFNQEIHPINLLYKIWAETNNAQALRLSLFEAKETGPLELYTSIILLQRTLKDWFADREIYHYLGFLFSNKHLKLINVWNEWQKENATRSDFIAYLLSELKEFVFGKELNGDSEETSESGFEFWLNKIKDYNSDNPTNWYEITQLKKFLLTLDVLEHSQLRPNGVPLPFLKPVYFKSYKEDKEHIYPGTPKDIKTISLLKEPAQSFSKYLGELNDGFSEDKLINWDFSQEEWDKYSPEQKNEKLMDLKMEIHEKRPINSIGNLVLLHLRINRGFGNNYYTDVSGPPTTYCP